jgi:uncharacterized membrane protein YdbT with pleckstrin-like domain
MCVEGTIISHFIFVKEGSIELEDKSMAVVRVECLHWRNCVLKTTVFPEIGDLEMVIVSIPSGICGKKMAARY